MSYTVDTSSRWPIKNWAVEIEDEATEQLRRLAQLPFIHSHVAVMPDAHAGKGSTVGTVIATRGAIIPSAVGVDIGCGMMAVELGIPVSALEGKLAALRHDIEHSVPVGFYGNKAADPMAEAFFASNPTAMLTGPADTKKALLQCGSLGGGNHFIEVCTDLNGMAWAMLHSGSRNIGKTLAEWHIGKAKGLMKSYFIDLPDPDLAYLVEDSAEFSAYMADLQWAQAYAAISREIMMARVLAAISRVSSAPLVPGMRVNCHHNYTSKESHFGKNVWVTRKGAVSAREGQLGVIPGSMGSMSFIVEGLGNRDSFCSCSHGAGRAMSRAEARRRFTAADVAAMTEGVECKKDDSVVDEAPLAYKSILSVMAAQADLVRPVAMLKQILCVKG